MQSKVQKLSCRRFPDISAPDQYAQASRRILAADRFVRGCVQEIKEDSTRLAIEAILETLHGHGSIALVSESPSALERAPMMVSRLAALLPYDAWWGGAGASEASHHGYPGGWLLHTATNLHALKGLMNTATDLRGLTVNRDAMLAAILLHDWAKPKLTIWLPDGTMQGDEGEYGHHIAALAEAYLRGLPEPVLGMLAGVHSGWWKKLDRVQSFFSRAAELLDQPELEAIGERQRRWATANADGWIIRQAEEAWYTGSRKVIQHIRPRLKQCVEVAVEKDGWRAAEWWLLMQRDEFEWASILEQGEEEFTRRVHCLLLNETSMTTSHQKRNQGREAEGIEVQ